MGNGLKALVIRPFDGTLSLSEELDLDYERDPETEPIGGGFVAVVEGLFGYGAAIVKTGAAQLQTLAADPETLALLPLTDDGEGSHWPELDNATTAEGLQAINDVLTANGAPNLPAGITVRQALAAIAPGVNFEDNDLG